MNVETNLSKQEQILQAATAEFHENGFADASMDRISTRAGVSKRTVYRYFESKEALFLRLVEQLQQRIVNELAIQHDPALDIRAQLAELGAAEGRILTCPNMMALTRMVVSELLRRPELAGETEASLDVKASTEALIRDAVQHGQLATDNPRRTAEEFIGLIKNRAFWPVIFGAPVVSADEMSEIVENAVTMIMSTYGTRSA